MHTRGIRRLRRDAVSLVVCAQLPIPQKCYKSKGPARAPHKRKSKILKVKHDQGLSQSFTGAPLLKYYDPLLLYYF